MNSLVRSRESTPAPRHSYALQAFLELKAAADRLTNIDAAGAQAIIATGAPAAILAELDVPATNRDVMVALGSLTAAFPSATNKSDLDAFAAVVVDNLPDGLSNLVLRLAVKQLIRHQRFLPAVSEILDAIDSAERCIRDVPEWLSKVATYVAPEETVWIDKDLQHELWRKVVALQGHSSPTDCYGGWRFQKSLVDEALAALEARRADEATGLTYQRPKAITGSAQAPPGPPPKPSDEEIKARDAQLHAVWGEWAAGKIDDAEAERRVEEFNIGPP